MPSQSNLKPNRPTFSRVAGWFLCGLLTINLVLSGCGSDDEAPAENGAETPANATSAQPASQPAVSPNIAALPGQSTNSGGGRPPADVRRVNGRDWIGDIPLNVWYRDPLAVAGDTTPAGTNPGTNPVINPGNSVGTPVGRPPTSTNGSSNTGGGAVAWNDLISIKQVDGEVRNIRNRLKSRLQTPAAYNSSYLELMPHIYTLTAMALVAEDHSEQVTWSQYAKQIRALSMKMSQEKLQRNPKSYKQVQIPFEQVDDILNGNAPVGLNDVPGKVPFAEAIPDMGELMKRFEVAEKWLTVNANSENSLESRKEEIIQEVLVLAVLTKITTQEGYGYYEDEDFQAHTNPMIKACLDMAKAAEAGNYEAFDLGMSTIRKSCTECHADYR